MFQWLHCAGHLQRFKRLLDQAAISVDDRILTYASIYHPVSPCGFMLPQQSGLLRVLALQLHVTLWQSASCVFCCTAWSAVCFAAQHGRLCCLLQSMVMAHICTLVLAALRPPPPHRDKLSQHKINCVLLTEMNATSVQQSVMLAETPEQASRMYNLWRIIPHTQTRAQVEVRIPVSVMGQQPH